MSSPLKLGANDNRPLWENVRASHGHDKAPWGILADSLDESDKPWTAHIIRTIYNHGMNWQVNGEPYLLANVNSEWPTNWYASNWGEGESIFGHVYGVPFKISKTYKKDEDKFYHNIHLWDSRDLHERGTVYSATPEEYEGIKGELDNTNIYTRKRPRATITSTSPRTGGNASARIDPIQSAKIQLILQRAIQSLPESAEHQRTTDTVRDLFGHDPDGVHAWQTVNNILSVDTPYKEHTTAASDIVSNWLASNKPTDEGSLSQLIKRVGDFGVKSKGIITSLANVQSLRNNLVNSSPPEKQSLAHFGGKLQLPFAPLTGVTPVDLHLSKGAYNPNFDTFENQSDILTQVKARLSAPGELSERQQNIVSQYPSKSRLVDALAQMPHKGEKSIYSQLKVVGNLLENRPHYYLAFKEAVEKASLLLGWSPEEVQESLWTSMLGLLAAKNGIPVDRVQDYLNQDALSKGWKSHESLIFPKLVTAYSGARDKPEIVRRMEERTNAAATSHSRSGIVRNSNSPGFTGSPTAVPPRAAIIGEALRRAIRQKLTEEGMIDKKTGQLKTSQAQVGEPLQLQGTPPLPFNHNNLHTWLGDRQQHVVGPNKIIYRDGHNIKFKLYNTDIITYHPDNTFTLNKGGFDTLTTKRNMNQYSPLGLVPMSRDKYRFNTRRIDQNGQEITNPEENSFINHASQNPKDVSPWLVYADWLDEQHDPRADNIRRVVPNKLRKLRIILQKAVSLKLAHYDEALDFVPALQRAVSSNHRLFIDHLKTVLLRAGIHPQNLLPAVHDLGNAARVSVVALGERTNPQAQTTGAAWTGLLGRQPGMVSFTAHPQGQDSIYNFSHKDANAVRSTLDSVGVMNRVLVPSGTTYSVYLYDKGRQKRPQVAQALNQLGVTAEEWWGTGEPVGGKTSDMGREQYRNTINKVEAKQMSLTSLKVRRAIYLALGMNEHDAFRAGIDAAPHDDAPKLVYSDFLRERGDEDSANLWRQMAEHKGDEDFHPKGYILSHSPLGGYGVSDQEDDRRSTHLNDLLFKLTNSTRSRQATNPTSYNEREGWGTTYIHPIKGLDINGMLSHLIKLDNGKVVQNLHAVASLPISSKHFIKTHDNPTITQKPTSASGMYDPPLRAVTTAFSHYLVGKPTEVFDTVKHLRNPEPNPSVGRRKLLEALRRVRQPRYMGG